MQICAKVRLINYTGHNYHVKKIILCSDTAENLIHETMFNLEQSLQPENDIDSAYSVLCTCLKNTMCGELEYKYLKVQFGTSNVMRSVEKPWWNDTLSNLLNNLVESERNWSTCYNMSAKTVKTDFIAA